VGAVVAGLLEGDIIPVVADQKLVDGDLQPGSLTVELEIVGYIIVQHIEVVGTQGAAADVQVYGLHLYAFVACQPVEIPLGILGKTVADR
jgi:hypothetical protein